MSTQASKIVLVHGRYFVYHHGHNGHLSGLGQDCVETIPTDPEQYKDWLEAERGYNAKLTAQLEQEVYLVSEERVKKLLALWQTEAEQGPFGEQARPIWKDLPCGLYNLPTALCNVGDDAIDVERSYLIDLDRETFSVNNWIFFELDDIPRDRWISAFTIHDDHDVFSFEICPEAWQGNDASDSDTWSQDEQYRTSYQQYDLAMVDADFKVDVRSKYALPQIVGIMLFHKLRDPSLSQFSKYLSGWKPDFFAFRELAFAVLSFATGQFDLACLQNFLGYRNEDDTSGFLIDSNRGSTPRFMPLFAFGCHAPNQEPGSAPLPSIYWFQDVLISLVSDLFFDEDSEAAIAKTVQYGLSANRKSFSAIVFSIRNAIMLKISMKDGLLHVERTGIVPIYNGSNTDIDKPDDASTHQSRSIYELERVSRKHRGFVSLQNFFEAAANDRLQHLGHGCFPEIYVKIVAAADSATRKSCAQVSRPFRELCRERYSFSDNLTILKFEPAKARQERRPHALLNDLGVFTIRNDLTGQVTESSFDVGPWIYTAKERRPTTWCPVIGDSRRPSMMADFALRILAPTESVESHEEET